MLSSPLGKEVVFAIVQRGDKLFSRQESGGGALQVVGSLWGFERVYGAV